MAYKYTTINGQRVETSVAKAFQRMRAAFTARWGLDLLVSSATRTRAEQAHLYAEYRAGRGNLAAAPGMSNHEEGGPRGPRALDLRDSGKDAGVTVAGSARSNWLKTHAPSFGFDPAGFRFSRVEPWHYEFTGSIGFTAVVATAASKTATVLKGYPRSLQGIRWTGVQRMLKADFGYRGRIDNAPGSGTIAAFQRFMNAAGYSRRAIGRALVVDGIDGTNTLKAAQQWLLERWGYRGRVDGLRGTGTNAAWGRAEAANGRAYARIK